jgi:hypothetical protein
VLPELVARQFANVFAMESSPDVLLERPLAGRVEIEARSDVDAFTRQAVRQPACTTEEVNGVDFRPSALPLHGAIPQPARLGTLR